MHDFSTANFLNLFYKGDFSIHFSTTHEHNLKTSQRLGPGLSRKSDLYLGFRHQGPSEFLYHCPRLLIYSRTLEMSRPMVF